MYRFVFRNRTLPKATRLDGFLFGSEGASRQFTWLYSRRTEALRQGVLLLILSIPSLYIFLTLPPLWRDTDAFNEIASTFAPKGIIHYLPGYCLGGRLIVFAGSIVASLLGGHGIPYLSISAHAAYRRGNLYLDRGAASFSGPFAVLCRQDSKRSTF